MNRYFIIPRAELQPYVDRLWGWESEALLQLPPMLPGTGAELLFHYGTPFRLQSAGTEGLNLGQAHLLCARRAPHRLLSQAGLGFISVRFRSGALRHFCPVSLQAVLDEAVPIRDLWGQAGLDVACRVAEAADRASRVSILEDWLLACLREHGKAQPAMEAALRQLYYQHRSVRVDALAERLGMSRRHFERVFREQIGMTPKAFQRTARFHLTTRDLLLRAPTDCLASALDHGYYDQAHFIHDFQAFVGTSPLAFLKCASTVAHFYNPPIFTPDTVPLPR